MITTDGSILQTAGFIVCALLPFIPSILIYKQKKTLPLYPSFSNIISAARK